MSDRLRSFALTRFRSRTELDPKPASTPGAIRIRQAAASDANLLTAIAHAAKRHWAYPERWLGIWQPQLTITPAYLADHTTFVAEVDAIPAGFCALNLIGAEAELDHLWVAPAWMGRGSHTTQRGTISNLSTSTSP